MRQNIQVNPAQKVFEAFMDFSGGLNTEVSNEKLRENEYSKLLNADLSGKSSARLRYGRSSVVSQLGVAQGIFFYYRKGMDYPDTIEAVGGRLYVREGLGSILTEIPMLDGTVAFTFQATLPIEAVQYKETLFIATGTKLVELTYTTGWDAKVVVPYIPTVMEAIYIGTNGLADNPDAYIQDGVSSSGLVEAIGIKPEYRTAAKNVPITMTAYINVPSGYTGTIDYRWERRKSSETTWVEALAWTTDAKSHDFSFDTATEYDIRVSARKTADTNPPDPIQQYVLTSYEVKAVEDRTSVSPVDALSKCRKILLHWDRILLYDDGTYSYQMYISDLQNGRYFPVSNTINFDIGKQEPITTAIRFQDMLVVFTKTTIQTLVGKSVETYARYQIHDIIGCIAGWSAKVVGNNIYFLSHEGVHALKPNPYRLETMNVARIDGNIKSSVPYDEDACAVVHDSMYWLAFPQQKEIYRYYYETGAWAKDSSARLDIKQFLLYGEDVYNMTSDGYILQHDPTIFTDAGTFYEMDVESKLLDLSASFNQKKLKRFYMLAKHYTTHNVDLKVTIQADAAIVLTPHSGYTEVQADGSVVWVSVTEPNFKFYTGTSFGAWIVGSSAFGNVDLSVQKASIRGKCRRVKVRFQGGGDGKSCEVFGFGLEFKMKKV
jgi:hypothetical protein